MSQQTQEERDIRLDTTAAALSATGLRSGIRGFSGTGRFETGERANDPRVSNTGARQEILDVIESTVQQHPKSIIPNSRSRRGDD
jgi:hypothetical protein